MEAFPLIALLSPDLALQQAIAAQVRHCFKVEITSVSDPASLPALLQTRIPHLLVSDARAVAAGGLDDLRNKHPFMAILSVGEPALSFPLAASLPLPLSIPALVQQAERLLYERTGSAGGQTIRLHEHVTFIPDSRIIHIRQQAVALTDKETALLICLLHQGKLGISRNQLLNEVWGYTHNDITTHTLETHLSRLRGKLQEVMVEMECIRVQDGVYYPVFS